VGFDDTTRGGCVFLAVTAMVAAGFVLGMIGGGIAWVVVVENVPPDGSGNGAEKYGWFLPGGIVGASAVLLVSCRRPSPLKLTHYRYPWSSDRQVPQAVPSTCRPSSIAAATKPAFGGGST
jgi:hypothetical protein